MTIFVIVAVAIIAVFVWMTHDSNMLGKDPLTLRRHHCREYHLPEATTEFYFMSHFKYYVAIANDHCIHSSIDNKLKRISISDVARYEIIKPEQKSFYIVRVFEKNGNYHNYPFFPKYDPVNYFTDVLNAMLIDEKKGIDPDDLDEVFVRSACYHEFGHTSKTQLCDV